MKILEFYRITLQIEKNIFGKLCDSTNFENIGKGRIGNHLVKIEDQKIPIIRTTTQYKIPAKVFSEIHFDIIKKINIEIQNNKSFELPQLNFNNALIELYDKAYSKMNFHSDQSIDLEDNSYIGLFSCYANPNDLSEHTLRRLIVKEKDVEEEFEIPLTHNSVVLFSVKSNKKFLHKIILDTNQVNSKTDNKWLGITFRKSKTLIHFKDNLPYFSNGDLLVLANEEQKKEFFKLRGQENREVEFVYPNLTYTISVSDTLIPIRNRSGLSE